MLIWVKLVADKGEVRDILFNPGNADFIDRFIPTEADNTYQHVHSKVVWPDGTQMFLVESLEEIKSRIDNEKFISIGAYNPIPIQNHGG